MMFRHVLHVTLVIGRAHDASNYSGNSVNERLFGQRSIRLGHAVTDWSVYVILG